MIGRFCAACLLVAALTAFPLALTGRVMSVDYTNSVIVVRTATGDRTVQVTPSTDVDKPDGGYATIADVHRGTVVDVGASVVHGRIIAQFIRIR